MINFVSGMPKFVKYTFIGLIFSLAITNPKLGLVLYPWEPDFNFSIFVLALTGSMAFVCKIYTSQTVIVLKHFSTLWAEKMYSILSVVTVILSLICFCISIYAIYDPAIENVASKFYQYNSKAENYSILHIIVTRLSLYAVGMFICVRVVDIIYAFYPNKTIGWISATVHNVCHKTVLGIIIILFIALFSSVLDVILAIFIACFVDAVDPEVKPDKSFIEPSKDFDTSGKSNPGSKGSVSNSEAKTSSSDAPNSTSQKLESSKVKTDLGSSIGKSWADRMGKDSSSLGALLGGAYGEELGRTKLPKIGPVKGLIGGSVVGAISMNALQSVFEHIPAIEESARSGIRSLLEKDLTIPARPSSPDHTFNHFQDNTTSRS